MAKKFIPIIDEVMSEIKDDLRPDKLLKDALPSPEEVFGEIMPPPPHKLLREIMVGEKKKPIIREE